MPESAPISAGHAPGARVRRSGLRAAATIAATCLLAWAGAAVPAAQAQDRALFAGLAQLRNAFLKRMHEEGYRGCAPPTIEFGHPSPFAHYGAASNTIQVTPWSHLSAGDRASLAASARQPGSHATRGAGSAGSAPGWVFVRELGNWWQSCRQLRRPNSYGEENGATRIALAYWREQDPAFAAQLVLQAAAQMNAAPGPLPAGFSLLNHGDTHLPEPADARTSEWLQSRMITELAAERPPPSFHKALSQPLYPW